MLRCIVLLVAAVVMCLHSQLVEAQPRGGRVRGDEIYENNNNNIHNGRRMLFADMWRDNDNPGRGGAGAASKGLDEVIGMRDRATSGPGPTTTTPPTTNPPATPTPATTDPPVASNPNRNDRCANAIGPIEITAQGLGPSRAVVYDDTTVGAQVPVVTPDRCNRITNSAPGVWYKVVGTGDVMTASLCWPGTNFDSKITVYRGDCAGVLTCVNANDDAGGNFGACQSNNQASRVQWPSERGVMYHLLIHGFGAREGDFQLNVINFRPLNDNCENVIDMNPGDVVTGTTFQASFPFDGRAGNCDGQFGLIGESNTVWYRVTGTGGTLEASTCNPLTETTFDTKIHIFEDNCDIGQCIGGNDNFESPDRCSLYRWEADAGTEYYIMVHGFLTSNGLFELSLKNV